MWDVKACAVCLSTDHKLYSLNSGNLRHEFNCVSGLTTSIGSGLPDYLCVECLAYVKKFMRYRQRCHRAHYTLKQLLNNNKEIKEFHLNSIDKKKLGILSSLSLIDKARFHYETDIYHWPEIDSSSNNQPRTNYNVPILHYSTLSKEETFEDVMTNTTSYENAKTVKVEPVIKSNLKKTRRKKKHEPKALKTDITSLLEDKKYSIDDDYLTASFLQTNDIYDNDLVNDNALVNDNGLDNDNGLVNDNGLDNDMDHDNDVFVDSCKLDLKADGTKFNEEYAEMVPISVTEARAVLEVKKMFKTGPHKCKGCGLSFKIKKYLKIHSRMHDMHLKGNYHCELCNFYYKTQFLLDCHMTEKHMYKYVCRMCPEVSFDRASAKTHYCLRHLGGRNWEGQERPMWLKPKKEIKPKGKRNTAIPIPKEAFSIERIKPEEQYSMIKDRKTSRNYLEAKYKCEFCYRGYRLLTTFNNHMVKHNSSISGNLQCDMCKLYFRDQRKMYKHINMCHLYKFSCQCCEAVFTCRSQALAHYKWHKNVTYNCEHCDKKFVKASTRLTHIRLKHPSTFVCNLCGHSFVSSAGLTCHKQITHSKEITPLKTEEIKQAEGEVDPSNPNFCEDCNIVFANEQAFMTHLGSSKKHVKTNISVQKTQRDSRKRMRREMGSSPREPRQPGPLSSSDKRGRNGTSEVLNTGVTTANNCEMCGKFLVNDVQARRHYEAEHPGADFLRRYMCEVCGHTARQYANLLVHMRTHTNEKPYGCPHCDRRFSMLSNRDRHLVVHTGEKRFQCQHCNRRFTQSSAVKLHIQTVHLKIPYAPWDKKNRKRRKELEAAGVSSDINLVEAPPMPIMQPPQPKLLLDPQAEFIAYSACITFTDE